MPHRLLLRRRLGVEVDQDGVGAGLQPARLDLPLDRAERIVEIGHEHAPLRVDHEHVGAGLRLEQASALAGRALRKIERPEQPVVALDEHQRLALVEHVIARRHHVGAGVEQLGEDRLGDAETAGGVLAVHHDEIERIALAQLRQMLDHGDASGSADHVSKKQHAHDCSRSSRDRRIFQGVNTESRHKPPASSP